MNKTIIMAILAAAIASGGLASAATTALGQADKQDGWGEVTNEAARSGGNDFGDHSSDPSGDGRGSDDPDQNDDRVGLGNVDSGLPGGSTEKNLNELGCELASIDAALTVFSY